jgi:hypothetical protein
VRVALYGAGQVSGGVAEILTGREGIDVEGPYGRSQRARALGSGADVVIVATTSFLDTVAPDIREAVSSGSNVITTAEEAACAAAIDHERFAELDQLAREHGVTILGAGLNPGFAFDALALTLSGVCGRVDSLRIERVVDLSGFSMTVLRRIGVGHTAEGFAAGVASGEITGHIGFPQSMRVVADKLGVDIERIDRQIDPIMADREHQARYQSVAAGMTAGFRQHYTGIVDGEPWFEALFLGHLDPAAYGDPPRDAIEVAGSNPVGLRIEPGLDPQRGSAAIIANSVRRVVEARPGWVTVGDLPPAYPR